ncbi:nuclease-related domain-containing protein [Cecembia rubra]|uniref:Nuclease-like protein n=1 Tax=Cecembia rubra TaxID=1485585 RepID=A0A2P8DYI0_9BACT|nr:nuclease-related domain-containing protein [Cecembia rubra]PSL02263.1 nuclease-like protein [Cecembia rubra]
MPNLNTFFWIILSIILLVCFFVLFIKFRNRRLLRTVTNSKRGTKTERKLVLKLLKKGISAQTIFHDLYVTKQNGSFTQIDLVVLTTVGIIVIEVKHLSGWIYGKGNQSHWTQVLAYGKQKYRLYNPIVQNRQHINDLKRKSKQFENIPFYSLVVFYGDCVLKNVDYVPNGTFLVKANRIMEVIKMIKKKNPPAIYTDKGEVVKILKESVENGKNEGIQKRHIEDIKNLIGKHRIFE